MNISYSKSLKAKNTESLVFSIPLKIGFVYMYVSEQHKNFFLTFIKAKNYLKMWKNTQISFHKEYANQSVVEWNEDYKFSNINNEMIKSESMPVYFLELNNATLNKNRNKTLLQKIKFYKAMPSINIKDGITRSMWLLSKKAKVIPCICYSEKGAKIINEYSGFKRTSIFKFDSLYNSTNTNILL